MILNLLYIKNKIDKEREGEERREGKKKERGKGIEGDRKNEYMDLGGMRKGKRRGKKGG